MEILSVPYYRQININACGAACLAMVYQFYGIRNIDQAEIYNEYQELEPHDSGNYRITTDNLINDARKKGLSAGWARANYSNTDDCISLLRLMTNAGVPIIACQQLSKNQPLFGHFRVVTGIDKDSVHFHDPSTEIGGANMSLSIEDFINLWQPTGNNVTGGVFCFMFKSDNK